MKNLLILIALLLSLSGFQQHNNYDDFIKYVGKNFTVSDSIKYDCNWHYAVVRLTNKNNKVVKYECLNPVDNEIGKNLKFLIGYQFPQKFAINNRPVGFYLTIDNSAICKHKSSDRVYDPNDVVALMGDYLDKIETRNNKTIIIRDLILMTYYAPQH